ncbi:MAG: diguanylate cyclase [Alphaproteobacteria bacterium]|nr:diguanylate cyclase [Alphaproteobacteria bacterium]
MMNKKNQSLPEIEDHKDFASELFQMSRDAMIITDAKHRIICVNEAFTDMTGFETSDLSGSAPDSLLAGESYNNFFVDIWKIIEIKGEWRGKMWNRHKNGSLILISGKIIALKNNAGNVTNYICLYGKKFETEMYKGDVLYDSFTDVLTGTASRGLMFDRLNQAMMRAERYCTGFALMFVQIENLEDTNANFGYIKGDELVKRTASILISCCRESDLVGRWSGSSFLLAGLDTHNRDNTFILIDRVNQAFTEQRLIEEGGEVPIHIKMGVAMFPESASNPAALVVKAREAAESAKVNQIMFTR